MKGRRLKNAKSAIRKMRNLIIRNGDSWYSNPRIFRQRQDGKRDTRKQARELS